MPRKSDPGDRDDTVDAAEDLRALVSGDYDHDHDWDVEPVHPTVAAAIRPDPRSALLGSVSTAIVIIGLGAARRRLRARGRR